MALTDNITPDSVTINKENSYRRLHWITSIFSKFSGVSFRRTSERARTWYYAQKTRFFAKAWIRKHKKTTSNFSDVENQSFSAVSSAASPKNDNLVQFREKGLFSAGSAVLVQKVQNPISSYNKHLI